MTDLIQDPRLIRIYWLVGFYLEGPALYVEGKDELGWQLGERTLWCYLGEGRALHVSDSVLGVVISPDRSTLLLWIRSFVGIADRFTPQGDQKARPRS